MEDYGTITDSTDDKHKMLDSDELAEVHRLKGSTPDLGNFFRDGKRRIDFILVYEEKTETIQKRQQQKEKEAKEGKKKKLTRKEREKLSTDVKHDMWREKYLANLRKAGLQLEEEHVEGNKVMVTYIKLHAPWDILCFYAEDLSMRAPLQAHPNPSANWSERVLKTIKIPNIMQQDVPNTPLDFYTCVFRKSKMDRFLGSDDKDNFFMNKDRHRIVYEVLATTTYGKRKRAEIGIERMIEEEAFDAAFPLHDGPHEVPKDMAEEDHAQLNPRQILQQYWARWGRWYKYQPLDHIRDYFGEKTGIYFAWLGFYTAWLLPASVVGFLVFLYGVLTIGSYTPAKETCNSGDEYLMCPPCDESAGCSYYHLSEACMYTTASYLFDQPGTVFFAVFVSFWAVTFLEYWKRKTASLAHHWDCLNFEEEEERPRPQYTALCPTMEKNPVTGLKEPYFPEKDRIPRFISSVMVIIVMMVLVLIFIVAVILYRILIAIPLFENKYTRAQATTIASMSSAIVNLILIMALGKVYEKLAFKLTTWEMHRTQTEFEDALTFKVFLFQFVNFYSSIIYIGFFKGKFIGYPGNYTTLLGLRNEECQVGGCLIELALQLAVIMVGKQFLNNTQEIIVPKLKAWWGKFKLGDLTKHPDKARWEEDYELIENEGLFEEYLEMVLQFGFVTIFVAAFPIAPLFALLNNWVEIRLDANKFVTENRRAVAERAQDIGVWFTILDALAQLAVISNAFLIAFTSEFLPKLLYQYQYNWDLTGYVNFTLATSPNGSLSQSCRYKGFRDDEGNYTMFYYQLLCVQFAFVVVFEHVVFGICKLIDILVPDVPESLELKIKREAYLAKQALADQDTIMMLARREADHEKEMDEGQNGATLAVPQTSPA